jgi:5-methyltetrahydrofolate--homocysteine methyltransferase
MHEPGATSIYSLVPFEQDTSFMIIGERTNANGSKKFREALLDADLDTCVQMAKDQVREGAHVLDVCVDYVGRDGANDMDELAKLLATQSSVPLVLDSTEPAVLKAGLEHLGGRCVINSVNYEDGDGPSSRFAKIMPLVQEHGARVVALTIDEEGQARDAQWKLRVARRLINDLHDNWGMNVGDILIDCLTFPIATGQEETRKDGIETIMEIARLGFYGSYTPNRGQQTTELHALPDGMYIFIFYVSPLWSVSGVQNEPSTRRWCCGYPINCFLT